MTSEMDKIQEQKNEYKQKYNKVIDEINSASNINNGLDKSYVIHVSNEQSKHIHYHSWKYTYKLLNPTLYVDPSNEYPLSVKYDYVVNHLENVKAHILQYKPTYKDDDILSLIKTKDSYFYDTIYGHRLNYLKWLQDDDIGWPMDFKDSMVKPFQLYSMDKGLYISDKKKFNYNFEIVSISELEELMHKQLKLLYVKIKQDYFNCIKDLEKM
jgi:hypothetical protein